MIGTEAMTKVFLIEDDESLRREITRLLESSGYEVMLPDSFAKAHEDALASDADLLLVDLKLPENDGHDIVRAVRAQSGMPVIVITSSDIEFDEVIALNLGADDYITKPFSSAVLLARMQSVLRRKQPNGNASRRLSAGDVELDTDRALLSHRGRDGADGTVELTRNELRIMRLLMDQPGTVVSRADIMAELWDSDEFVDDNTLTVNVNRLRGKLSSIGVPDDFLTTRRGLGYMIGDIK